MTARRVLIVDDNAMNVDLVSYVLSADGVQVESAFDANQAAARIAAQPPDLILMDIQLPGVDGLELTRRLKADPATRHIVILALTAYAMKGDEARMRAAGCDGYIAKPIDVATFAGQVRAWLESPTGTAPPATP
jgi:two-component system, cell cycle response regulator DivK